MILLITCLHVVLYLYYRLYFCGFKILYSYYTCFVCFTDFLRGGRCFCIIIVQITKMRQQGCNIIFATKGNEVTNIFHKVVTIFRIFWLKSCPLESTKYTTIRCRKIKFEANKNIWGKSFIIDIFQNFLGFEKLWRGRGVETPPPSVVLQLSPLIIRPWIIFSLLHSLWLFLLLSCRAVGKKGWYFELRGGV